LKEFGFTVEEEVTVKVWSSPSPYYERSTDSIFLGSEMIEAIDIALRTYLTHVSAREARQGRESNPISIAAQDYFTCSFTDDPILGEKVTMTTPKGYPRTIRNDSTYTFLEPLPESSDSIAVSQWRIYEEAGIWGGAFWDIRELVGQERADRLLALAWKTAMKMTMRAQVNREDYARRFTNILLELAQTSLQPNLALQIQAIINHRNLPHGTDPHLQDIDGERVYKVVTPSLSVPDNDAAGAKSSLTIENSGVIRDFNVSVDITTSYRGDIKAVLVAPRGERFVLHNREGGSMNDLIATYGFDTTPSLRGLLDKSVAGNWTLEVSDLASMDKTILHQWSIEAIYNPDIRF
jgi:subtilisin-like proprotein convertase family protein